MPKLLTLLTLLLLAFAVATPMMVQAAAPVHETSPQPAVDDVKKIDETLSVNSFFRRGVFGKRLQHCVHNPPGIIGKTAWKEKKSARFTYCMRKILGEGTEEILDALADYMRPAMYAIILLATIIMGIKAVGGMFRNTKAETVVFVTRVAIVLVAFEHMDKIAALFFDMTDMILILLGKGAAKTFVSSSGVGFHCKTALYSTAYPDYEWIQIYDWLDCLFNKLYGLGKSEGVKNGFIAIAGASFFTGTTGAHLGMMFIGFFIAMGMFLLRVTGMLVMAYGAIALMMILLPIFMLTVFFKVTENYFFQQWLTLVVRHMVQPAIVIGFLYFAVAALDILIYRGSEMHFYKYEPKVSSAPWQKSKDPFGVNTKADIEVAKNPLEALSLTYRGYDPVIEPIFGIVGIDPLKDSAEVQSDKMTALVLGNKKLFEFSFDGDSGFYGFFEAQCGRMGVLNAFGSTATTSLKDAYTKGLSWISPMLSKITPDPDALKKKLDEGVNAPDGSKLKMWTFSIICSLGKTSSDIGLIRSSLEKKVNAFIPGVPILDFSSLAEEKGMEANEFQEKTIGKLIIAVFALIILGSTLYQFTNHIDAIARSIIGRMSMSLSIISGDGGGWSLSKGIKGGMNMVESRWKEMASKTAAGKKQ